MDDAGVSLPRPGNPLLRRFSSRGRRLSHTYLKDRLAGARRYRRIAGYFRSSIFEVADEELAAIDEVRIVCNSDLDPRDVRAAQAVFEAGLRESWSEGRPEVDAFLRRERYVRLHAALRRGNVKVRVLSRDIAPFLHGKAGLIEGRDGTRTAFMGSVNETREGWSENYEILWEDLSDEGADWVADEFEWLWDQGRDLPEAMVDEIGRLSERTEFASIAEVPDDKLVPAAIAEAPLYRRGERLQPWQRSFVEIAARERRIHGCARLLIADEVGLGKTLSMATAALYLALLGDGPVLLLVPATLTLQWQAEMWDNLGIPSAVWTRDKSWVDHLGHEVRVGGPEGVARCPYRFGIVSTGLIVHGAPEAQILLTRRYGTLILDEGHKARREFSNGVPGDPNNLLGFVLRCAARVRNLLIGTATPVQTHVSQVWDLMEPLAIEAPHVLGNDWSIWRRWDRAFALIAGREMPGDEAEIWELLRNPLPPSDEHWLFDAIRQDLKTNGTPVVARPYTDLGDMTRLDMRSEAAARRGGTTFFQRHNPLVRHVVLRRRAQLEDKGLLPRIAVNLHPEPGGSIHVALHVLVDGKVETGDLLAGAIQDAESYTRARVARARKEGRGAGQGFIKAILMQRIGSSAAAGLRTARKLLGAEPAGLGEDDDDDVRLIERQAGDLSEIERRHLEAMVAKLESIDLQGGDPKFRAIRHYLVEESWHDLGAIVFSQYYDTAEWIAARLAQEFPAWRIALYAGAGRSRIMEGGRAMGVDRDVIKKKVRDETIRLVVATDAACEGLNLQRLGTLINVDLPWNPSRLEQRIGRIKRFGQTRGEVDVLNLVYRDSWDERVLARLSSRLKDRYDLFGGLPDVIDDDWIEDIEGYERYLDSLIDARGDANAFELRYAASMEPDGRDWALCAEVLSRIEVDKALARPW